MNPGTVRWLLLGPVLGYALGVVALAAPPLGPVGLLIAVAVAFPLVEVGTSRLGVWPYLPGAIVALLVALGVVGWVGHALLSSLVLALIVASPAWLLGAFWRVRESQPWSVLALVGGIELALFDVSVARSATGSTSSVTSTGWFDACHRVLEAQWQSIAAFGHGASIPPADLSSVPDVGFALLAVLPFVGFLGLWLHPAAGRTAPTAVGGGPAGPLRPPPARLVSLAAAVGSVVAFEAAAALLTTQVALVAVAVATAEVALALAVASRWPSSRARPAHGSPATRETAPSNAVQ